MITNERHTTYIKWHTCTHLYLYIHSIYIYTSNYICISIKRRNSNFISQLEIPPPNGSMRRAHPNTPCPGPPAPGPLAMVHRWRIGQIGSLMVSSHEGWRWRWNMNPLTSFILVFGLKPWSLRFKAWLLVILTFRGKTKWFAIKEWMLTDREPTYKPGVFFMPNSKINGWHLWRLLWRQDLMIDAVW